MATKYKDKAAYDKMIKARTTLIINNPFFGCLALHLNLIEIEDPQVVHTMAVDGVNLYYHPPFAHALSEREIIGVLAHEVMHCCYLHFTRRQGRHPDVWNWAGNYVINDDLLKAGFTLPKKRLHDPKYQGMSTEEVYARIFKDAIKIRVTGVNGGRGGIDDKGDCGGVWDAAAPHDKAAADKIAVDWEGNVRMAVNTAIKNAGKVPGYLERLVHALKKPKISWRDATRDWIDTAMPSDYSWSRPNRRYLSQNIILPGFIPDALHHLIFIADTSGSVSMPVLTSMLGEVGGALDQGTADKLTVLYADTRVAHVDEFLPGDVVKPGSKNLGGGGTDFRAAFEWVKEHAPDASGIIYLTDMCPCTWAIEEPDLLVLWGAWATEQFIESVRPQVPFGSIVLVDGAE